MNKSCKDGRSVLSSLGDSVPAQTILPALKRWAIFFYRLIDDALIDFAVRVNPAIAQKVFGGTITAKAVSERSPCIQKAERSPGPVTAT